MCIGLDLLIELFVVAAFPASYHSLAVACLMMRLHVFAFMLFGFGLLECLHYAGSPNIFDQGDLLPMGGLPNYMSQ